MRSPVLLPFAGLLLFGTPAHAQPAKRLRQPALSPDGKTIVFSHQGDLWSVPAAGGRASRLTVHGARDVYPVFSPDGKSIAFASNRYGSYDLYAMPAEGGPAVRLTFHGKEEYPTAFTRDGKWILFHGNAYGALDVYKVPTQGGEPVRLTWDWQEKEYNASASPDGQWIAYNHNGSFSGWRRRGYEGSGSSDVWIARLTTPVSEPRRLTTNAGNDYSPCFSPDGKRLYYVSDRKGKVNLWSMDLQGGTQKQVTQHETDGVRFPSIALAVERAAYEYDSQIWLADLKTGKSSPVPVEIVADDRRNLTAEVTVTSRPSEASVSPDGKKVALIVRGDLFVVPATGGPARRLVGRPSRESHVAWMPDSRTLLFCTDEKGQKDLKSIEISGENERTLAGTEEDETNPKASPDGRLIAYHRGDKALAVIPPSGGGPAATIPGDFPDAARGYSPHFDWSPDSRWLVFRQKGAKLEDSVWVASLADGQARRVSTRFRNVGMPHFSPDGKLIYFAAAAVDSRNLYAIDLTDGEPPRFDEDALDRLDQPDQRMPVGAPSVSIDFDVVERRLRRVTSTGNVYDAVMSPSGRTFLVEIGDTLRIMPAESKNATGTQIAENVDAIELTADGSRVFFFSDGQVQSLNLLSRERRTTPFSATVSLDLNEENRQVFGEAWWLMNRYFYDDRLKGVDWKAVRARYEALLAYTPSKEDFYELLEEMVQELRGSHLGVTGLPDYTTENPTSTAYLGIEPDWGAVDREGKLRIGRVVPGSPADSKWSKLSPGEYILAVDGEELKPGATLDRLLDRKAGKKVVLTVNGSPSPSGARQVAIKPLEPSDGADLEYGAWVEARRKMVQALSGGKIAYLHVREMDDPAELRFKEEFVGEATDRDALLVDVRYNSGGNVAHRLLDILRKKPYVAFRPRSLGKQVFSDWADVATEYLWGKPSALLVNQDSASNSEMMAEGFRALGIGPIIGTPTRGAVIATSRWRFMDGGAIRLPASGVFTASGEDLEAKGREPDVVVAYDPIAIRDGRDPQLEKAVQVLMSKMAPTTVKK